jgi:DNA-binding response OmpR family regulator
MSRSVRLLLFSGDACLRDMLTEQTRSGREFEIITCTTYLDVQTLLMPELSSERIDLIIVDGISCSDEDRDLFSQNRFSVPVLWLVTQETNREDINKIQYKNASLEKPFRFSAFIASIRTLLREERDSTEARIQIGPFTFWPENRVLVRISGSKIRLTEKEAAILLYLHQAHDRTVPREELLQNVWGYHTGVTTHTIETHIYRLRRKIELSHGDCLLVTKEGGYNLID